MDRNNDRPIPVCRKPDIVHHHLARGDCRTHFYLEAREGLGFARWTTQDILIVAIMGVLLEVYDNLIGDQFITPIIQLIPFGHALALNDLPYMFLLMVGIALIRKPGAATAMVFLNYILMELIYSGSGVNVLLWPYGIFQGLFVDLYFVLRGTQVFANGDAKAFWDGLAMGALRAVPAVTMQSAILGPFFEGETLTLNFILLYSLFNMIGNGLEAAISSPLALRIARSFNQSTGQIAVASSVPLEGDGQGSALNPTSDQAADSQVVQKEGGAS